MASVDFCSTGSVLMGGSPFFPQRGKADSLPGLGALHLVFFQCSKFQLPSTLMMWHQDPELGLVCLWSRGGGLQVTSGG